jgi:hypothetical protein
VRLSVERLTELRRGALEALERKNTAPAEFFTPEKFYFLIDPETLLALLDMVGRKEERK